MNKKYYKNEKFYALEPRERKVAEMWCDPENKLCKRQVMEECGISESKFKNLFRKNDLFCEYVEFLIEKYTSQATPKVWKALIRKAVKGETQAIKLYFELIGKYKQNINLTGNITFIEDIPDVDELNVVEAIDRDVPEGEICDDIGDDVDG